MKYIKIVISAAFLLSLSVGVASAQESDGSGKYHPFLSSPFQIGLGVFSTTSETEIGGEISDTDLQDSVHTSDDQSTAMLDLRWRYTENWSFEANYWESNSDRRETLNQDFTFDGETYEAGTFLEAGLDSSVARLFWGRSFNRTARTDWGVGLGLHWLDLDVYVKGKVVGSAPSDGEVRASASAGAPLPNFGIWYMHSWSPKWVVITRLDWLDITFDEFSGRMIDASVGVNYQMSDHFGVGLAFNTFDIDLDVDGDNWKGGIETRQYGPRLNLTWNW
jgi:hypothetical protein